VQAEQALEVERRAERDLIGIVDQLPDAAADVVGKLADIDELDIDTLVEEVGPVARPIARQPGFGVPGERVGSDDAAREQQSQRHAER